MTFKAFPQTYESDGWSIVNQANGEVVIGLRSDEELVDEFGLSVEMARAIASSQGIDSDVLERIVNCINTNDALIQAARRVVNCMTNAPLSDAVEAIHSMALIIQKMHGEE